MDPQSDLTKNQFNTNSNQNHISMMATVLSNGGGSSSGSSAITSNSINNGTNGIVADEFPPMIFRSMSDASAIRRQQLLNQQLNGQHNAPYSRHANNLYGSSWIDHSPDLLNLISPSMTSSRQGLSSNQRNNNNNNGCSLFASSSNQSNSCDQMVELNHSNTNTSAAPQDLDIRLIGFNSNNPVANVISNGHTDEDDYDLNLVFDEIGALQNKGLNEPEDDNSTAPLQLPSPRSMSLGSAQLQHQMKYSESSATATKKLATVEVDNKKYKYDPEVYDPVDITLANEKYALNAHSNHFDMPVPVLTLDGKMLSTATPASGPQYQGPINAGGCGAGSASPGGSIKFERNNHYRHQQRHPLSLSTIVQSQSSSLSSSTSTSCSLSSGSVSPRSNNSVDSISNDNNTNTNGNNGSSSKRNIAGRKGSFNRRNNNHTASVHNNNKIGMSPSTPEKPLHYNYLRDFRCEQCPLFLQHKCTQHKPFTCFHWHFANQRRRRPLRKRDGTFNYSPDIYCAKYDDTSGICPDGDDCPYLHRTAGDTERRYHLRYYKTGMCVYETDARGYCAKNGAHCAFAHGSHDLRMAVFDVREQVQMASGNGGIGGDSNDAIDGIIANGCSGNGVCNGTGANHMFEKDRNAVHEDPRWQNTAFVLAYYKTELCKRPPRLCRQGYACPQYHNNKDRRRSPKKFKYRSTPCPNVKPGDEWGDPVNCENQDDCAYCHTRTEQQFHPEIYKSTKCNDIQQSGHCPRGPFCAFAHSESTDEINSAREFSMDPNTEIPPSISCKLNGNGPNTSPVEIVRANSYSRSSSSNNHNSFIASSLPEHGEFSNFDLSAPQPPHQMAQPELSSNGSHHQNNSNLGPIARPRSFSTSTTTKTMSMNSMGNWLDKSSLLHKQTGLKNHNQAHPPTNLFSAASSTSLFPSLHSQPQEVPAQQAQSSAQNGPSGAAPASFTSALSSSIYDSQQNSAAAVSAAIDTMLNQHDLNFDELDSLVNATNSVENHLSALESAGSQNPTAAALNSLLRRGSLFNESEPINIPHSRITGNDVRSTSAAGFNMSPPNAGLNAGSPIGSFLANRQSLLNGSQTVFDPIGTMNGATTGAGGQPTPANSLATPNQNYMSAAFIEMQRLKDENSVAKNRIAELQEKMQQMFQLCQIQISEAHKKEKIAEKTRDEALNRLNNTQKELELMRTSESNAFQKRVSDLSTMSRNQLMQLQQRLAHDMNCVEEALKIGNVPKQSGTA